MAPSQPRPQSCHRSNGAPRPQFRAFVFRKKKSESSYHHHCHTPDVAVHEHTREPESDSASMCTRMKAGRRLERRRALHVEIERDQRKRNIGLISKLPLDQDEWPTQLSAPTAAHLKRTNCGRAERTMWHESHVSCEILCNFTSLKNACRIRNHFYWNVTSAPRGAFPSELCSDAFSMLSGQDRDGTAHYRIKKTEADSAIDFVNKGVLSLQFAIYNRG